MEKTEHHFFVCNSFRVSGEARGVCHKKNAVDLLRYLEGEISDRGMNASVTVTGCFNVCEKGPVMVHYPSGAYYGQLNEERLDTILDALEDGGDAEELRLT